jgi:hypothetical protein
MKMNVYQKERIRSELWVQVDLSNGMLKQVFNDFGALSSFTYTLDGFLFDLDQNNICRNIQKIERLIRQCILIPQKIYRITKRLLTPDEVEQYFPGFLSFIDSQNNKFQDL